MIVATEFWGTSGAPVLTPAIVYMGALSVMVQVPPEEDPDAPVITVPLVPRLMPGSVM
jgi:hypothetical protein